MSVLVTVRNGFGDEAHDERHPRAKSMAVNGEGVLHLMAETPEELIEKMAGLGEDGPRLGAAWALVIYPEGTWLKAVRR